MPTDKKITLAKYAGFCYGVKRAVETVKKIKSENPDKEVYVLGELIHNNQVISELKSYGINSFDKLPEKGDGICVIRSHGESPEIFSAIEKAGFKIYDLTCPDVKKVQQKAIELVKSDYYLIIVGKEEHPEVIAIKANALQHGNDVLVATKTETLKNHEKELKEHKKIGVVVQTTQTSATLAPIINYLATISKELHIVNTICPSTSMRQNEVIQLAKENDLMIIAGSKKSANTTHLADISKEYTKTIHIETAQELNQYKKIIAKAKTIGVSAGASTPQNVIDEVIEVISGGKI